MEYFRRVEVKYRRFGNIPTQVSVIGLGTWNMESLSTEDFSEVIHQGLDYGMTHIDTAEMYGEGRVEILLGKAIHQRRDNIFLVSKVLPSNAARKKTILACERSLRRLQTDYLDCYLLHWPGSHPLEETLSAFQKLQENGKIRSWGVSNFNETDLARAMAVRTNHRMTCNQVLYHLKERAIEHSVLPFCEQNEMVVVAYSPFGSGRFPSPGSHSGRMLSEIAATHSASPRQIALAFLIRHPSVFAIPQTSQLAHVEENALAAQIILTDEDVKKLDQAFPLGSRPDGIPTL
jgi:diketogulonate reductase-like aldo/keto reductase